MFHVPTLPWRCKRQPQSLSPKLKSLYSFIRLSTSYLLTLLAAMFIHGRSPHQDLENVGLSPSQSLSRLSHHGPLFHNSDLGYFSRRYRSHATRKRAWYRSTFPPKDKRIAKLTDSRPGDRLSIKTHGDHDSSAKRSISPATPARNQTGDCTSSILNMYSPYQV